MSRAWGWRRSWCGRSSGVLRELTRSGMTLFLVEQNANHALKLSDRGYVMVNGQIRLTGSGEELLNDPQVRKAYLGGG